MNGAIEIPAEKSYFADQRFELLRDRDAGDTSVSNVELFFDLVYVFAITQLSHLLLENLTLRGALESTIIMLAVWWAWIDTSWITNWFDPLKLPVRFMLFGLMFLGLVMSAATPEAFAERGMMFAAAYVTVQVGRTLFCVIALGANEQALNFRRILFWAVLSAPLWIAGAITEGDTRLWLWIGAVSLDFVAPALGFRAPLIGASSTHEWTISGEHLAERCQLFIIICLGESILLTGAALAGHEITAASFLAFTTAFAMSVLMWWVYFSHAGRGAELVGHADDQGAYGRAYTYFHMPMVAGIITLAVANELIIVHPNGETSTAVAAVTLGGAAIYLVGNALFNWTLTRVVPWRRALAILALGAIGLIANLVSPLALLGLVLLVFVALAIADHFGATAPMQDATADTGEFTAV